MNEGWNTFVVPSEIECGMIDSIGGVTFSTEWGLWKKEAMLARGVCKFSSKRESTWWTGTSVYGTCS